MYEGLAHYWFTNLSECLLPMLNEIIFMCDLHVSDICIYIMKSVCWEFQILAMSEQQPMYLWTKEDQKAVIKFKNLGIQKKDFLRNIP